ncbi:MAG: hypothetical protein HC888_19955, partial [Candidatus Competibacteraceae bacterium]|nr:hypothetical protein [Candidatus Competibacteraceae bacterium]
MGTDDCIRSDMGRLMNYGATVDNGSGMDQGFYWHNIRPKKWNYQGLTMAKEISPSQAILSPTFACTFTLPRGPFILRSSTSMSSLSPGVTMVRNLITVHAGESDGAASVRDAMDLLGAQRIGHGVRAAEDPALIDLLVERAIVLEVCPVSNVRSGVFSRIKT